MADKNYATACFEIIYAKERIYKGKDKREYKTDALVHPCTQGKIIQTHLIVSDSGNLIGRFIFLQYFLKSCLQH